MSLSNEGNIKDYILSQLNDEERSFIEGVEKPWKPEEVLIHGLKQTGFTDVVLIPHKNRRDEIGYKPWFYITGLAEKLGYEKPKMVQTRTLNMHQTKKYAEILSPQSRDLEIILPNDFPTKRRNMLGMTDYEGAKYLIDHVAHTKDTRFNTQAKETAQGFQTMMNKLQVLTGDIIDMLNHCLTQYQLKEKDKQIKLLQAPPSEAIQKEADHKARVKLANKIFSKKPDTSKDNGYVYIYATKEQLVRILVKIGKATNSQHRKIQHDCSHPDSGELILSLPVWHASLCESLIHKMLKRSKILHYSKEFFRLPHQVAIEMVTSIVNKINGVMNDEFPKCVEATKIAYIEGQFDIEEEPSDTEEEDTEDDTLTRRLEELLRNKKYILMSETKLEKLLTSYYPNNFQEALDALKYKNNYNYTITKGNNYKISPVSA